MTVRSDVVSERSLRAVVIESCWEHVSPNDHHSSTGKERVLVNKMKDLKKKRFNMEQHMTVAHFHSQLVHIQVFLHVRKRCE